jgi:hypothetical protein
MYRRVAVAAAAALALAAGGVLVRGWPRSDADLRCCGGGAEGI